MSKYKSLYFLHIPKTGGRILKFSVINQIRNSQDQIKISIKNDDDLGHQGWQTDIDDDTYIISMFRHPMEFVCSWFSHFGGIDESVNLVDLKKEMFIFMRRENSWFNNYQSKNIVYGSDKSLTQSSMESNFNNDINMDLLNERINRINLFFTTDFLKEAGLERIMDKICKDLNIDRPKIYLEHGMEDKYKSQRSKDLYLSLNQGNKNEIYRYFKTDFLIYEKLRNAEKAGKN